MRLDNFVIFAESISDTAAATVVGSSNITPLLKPTAIGTALRDGSSSETRQAGYHVMQSSGSMDMSGREYPTDPRAELQFSALPADHADPGNKGTARVDVIIFANSREFLEV